MFYEQAGEWSYIANNLLMTRFCNLFLTAALVELACGRCDHTTVLTWSCDNFLKGGRGFVKGFVRNSNLQSIQIWKMKYSYAHLYKSLVSVFWGVQWIVWARIRHVIEASYWRSFWALFWSGGRRRLLNAYTTIRNLRISVYGFTFLTWFFK